MFTKLTKIQKWTVFTFMFVPLLSSLISTIHIVDFFEIGNFLWMAYVLSAAFEIGSIASAIALTVLDKISKFAVWSIFVILVFFQLLGNIFFSFEYITQMQLTNPEYLNTIYEFLNYFYEFENSQEFKVTLSILIGMPIPLISLAFLKSVIDYIGNILKDQNSENAKDLNNNSEKLIIDKTEDETEDELNPVPLNNEFNENLVSPNDTQYSDGSSVEIDIDTNNLTDTTEIKEDTTTDEDEKDVNTFVFNGENFTDESSTEKEDESDPEKKTEYIKQNNLSPEELEELIEKKEEIELQYDKMLKMKKQLKEFYPQVYGKRYEGI